MVRCEEQGRGGRVQWMQNKVVGGMKLCGANEWANIPVDTARYGS